MLWQGGCEIDTFNLYYKVCRKVEGTLQRNKKQVKCCWKVQVLVSTVLQCVAKYYCKVENAN